MLGPRITPAGTPPTRSATAERAAATIASARPEAGKTPPRLAIGMRSAWAMARATLSGTSAPAGPSACTKPSASAGNRPRTRATSSRASPTLGTLMGDGLTGTDRSAVARSVPGPSTTRLPVTDTGQDGGMSAPETGSEHPQQVVVVGADGRPVGTMPMPSASSGPEGQDGGVSLNDMVEEPAKVMRIGTMIKQLLEEVRAAPLDDASRNRLRDIHAASIRELEEGLSPDLREELERITLPFSENQTPSDAELRIAQAQLVGWLEGVFHGIQTALFAQQMAARAQLEEMRRRALPGGQGSAAQPDFRPGGGQYL